jgi:predicted nucleotidyltransferase
MSGSSIDLTDKRELTPFADVIAAVLAQAGETPVLLVGAMARDFLLTYAYGIAIARGTADIDFALAISNWMLFAHIRERLIDTGDFTPRSKDLHRLVHRNGIPIDLIPFDGVEKSTRKIEWPPDGDVVMNVLGYREAMLTAMDAHLPGGHMVKVVALPALAIMKLIAWTERSVTAPKKDAYDLHLLLRHYLEAGNRERMYEEASHLLAADHFDYESAGAWLLGADARAILDRAADAASSVAAIDKILALQTDPNSPLHLVADMNSRDPQKALNLLNAFYQGFQSKLVAE